MNGLLDHGLQNQRFNEQVQNMKQGLLGQYIEGVKSRMSGLLDNPAQTLYNAVSGQMGINLDRPIAEYAEMARNPQRGSIDPNSPAMQEAMGWLPGPADNISGLLGTISKPKKGVYYHVAKNYDGGDLDTLYKQYGDDAFDMYSKKWPDSGELNTYHATLNHLFDNVNDAMNFQRDFGGRILRINDEDDILEVFTDTLEFPHPVTRYSIPSDMIEVLE